jgi:hypothetical protein
MTARTIVLSGARGGHGTTTVATALAVYAAGHRRTALVSADATSTAALIGIPMPAADEWIQVTENLVLTPDPALSPPADIVVIDAGLRPTTPCEHSADEHYVVLRGPCYVALASLLAASGDRPDGIILVAEAKRSLTARDVTDVLDVPVIATLVASPDVARTIDAGLLVSRLHRLRDLAPLRALATDPYAGRLRPSTAHPRQRLSTHSKTHTDLPLSQSDNGAESSRAVKRVALSASRGYVDGVWERPRGPNRAEHRPARARRGGLLHRRGSHLRRGLLHGQGRVPGSLGRLRR